MESSSDNPPGRRDEYYQRQPPGSAGNRVSAYWRLSVCVCVVRHACTVARRLQRRGNVDDRRVVGG